MGLLEKAQQKKPLAPPPDTLPPTVRKTPHQTQQQSADSQAYRVITPPPKTTPQQPMPTPQRIEHPASGHVSLLDRARLKKTGDTTWAGAFSSDNSIEIIEAEDGFGYKKLGKKRIIFDHKTDEYRYEVDEPTLTDDERSVKKELSHLFKMLADINTFDMDKKEKEKFLLETLEHIIIDNDIAFEEPSRDAIFYHIFRDFLGYGRIDILMHDDGIEDVSCDGPDTPIFIHHRKYEAIESNIYFDDEPELNSFLGRLCQISGKQISIFSPIVDGKLPDGSRLQATLAKTVTKGSTFTIRKFRETPLTPIDLIDFHSMSTEMAAYFWMAIEDGASVLFCGGTASGKTTALNALMLFIPASHKIISIEDTREVNIPHKNWIAGTTRKGFAASDESKSGKDIDMFDLIRAALRQRPRVIIVGEVRGKEAYSLFQAMATGHTAYATVHASTIHTLIQRLENPPIELPRALLTSLDVIVFQNAVDIGGKMVRRMTSVTEIVKLDTDTNQLIFMAPYTWVSKTDDRFDASGSSKILNRIKTQNDWTDEQLQEEIDRRVTVLEWMRKKNIRSYKDFGSIIAEYHKFPQRVLDMARKESVA